MKVTLSHSNIVAGIALYLRSQGFANVRAENLDVAFTAGRKDKGGLSAAVEIGDLTSGEARKGTADLDHVKSQLGAATVADVARAEPSPVEKAKGELANTTADVAPETPLTAGNAEVAQPVPDQVVADPVTGESEAASTVADANEPAPVEPAAEGTEPAGKSLFG